MKIRSCYTSVICTCSLGSEQKDILVSNLSDLKKLHKKLFDDLREPVEQGSVRALAQVFINVAKVYATYLDRMSKQQVIHEKDKWTNHPTFIFCGGHSCSFAKVKEKRSRG